jgi:hypothetical protein
MVAKKYKTPCKNIKANNLLRQFIHRCTRVENPGEVVAQIFAKIPGGYKAFGKKCQGGSPYFGFYCIFIIIKSLEILLGGFYIYPPPSSCVHLRMFLFSFAGFIQAGVTFDNYFFDN